MQIEEIKNSKISSGASGYHSIENIEDSENPFSGYHSAQYVSMDSPAKKTLGNHSEDAHDQAETSAQFVEYALLDEPWNSYFRAQPKILIVSNLPEGILNLLNEEQALIQNVLDSSISPGESSRYVELGERLEELKMMIPAAETASGYVPGSRRSYSYSYISGGTIYQGRSYYGYRYRVLQEKHQSSSPELVRSVQGLVHNASLELSDLNQRIEALQGLMSSWSRRTSEMSASGTSGLMRKANEAYLEALRDFMGDLVELRSSVRRAESEAASIQENKLEILANWRTFEEHRLPVLSEYLTSNAITEVKPTHAGSFRIPQTSEGQQQILVLRKFL